jgi:hypothetical protein
MLQSSPWYDRLEQVLQFACIVIPRGNEEQDFFVVGSRFKDDFSAEVVAG